jgi:tetratricopeptide (TPR) repeat protein
MGFLGAYFIALMILYQRYVTDDLMPPLFVAISVRIFMVLIITTVLFATALSPDAAGAAAEGAAEGAAAWPALVVAFAIGIFPSAGVRLLIQAAGRFLSFLRFESFDERLPLGELDGVNVLSELRLHDEYIDNVENMATADIVELFLRTRFPAERIIDWVDQALLQIHLSDSALIARYRAIGIRTASDLIDAYERACLGSAPAPATAPLPAGTPAAERLTIQKLRARLARADAGMAEPGALETLVAALERDPNMYSVRYWREHEFDVLPRDANLVILPGVLALLNGEPREAIRVVEGAGRGQRRYPPIHFYLGLAYGAEGNHDQSIRSFDEAIRLNEPSQQPRPDSYHYYLARGRARLARARQAGRDPQAGTGPALEIVRQAIDDLRTAAELPLEHSAQESERVECRLRLGEALALLPDKEHREKAARVLQEGIDLDPGRSSPFTVLAYRLRALVLAGFLGNFPDAATLLAEPVRDRRADHELLLLLGELRLGLNEWDAADSAFRYAEALAGATDPRPALGVARVQKRRGSHAAAVELARAVTARWPNDGPSFLQLGRALFARATQTEQPADAFQRDLEAAEAALLRAAQLEPRNPAVPLALGRVLVRLGRPADARAQLQRAQDLVPRTLPGGALTAPEEVFTQANAYAVGLPARVLAGELLESLDDRSAAETLYREATKLSLPKHGFGPHEREEWDRLAARAYLNLGKTIYEQQRSDQEAEAAFNKAVEFDTTLVEAVEYQGLAHLAQANAQLLAGKPVEAATLFEQLQRFVDEQPAGRSELPLLRLLRGVALLETGGAQRAEAELRAAGELLAAADRGDWLAVSRYYLGRAQLAVGQPRRAMTSLTDAEVGVNFLRSPVTLYDVHLAKARALRAAGEAADALEAARQAQLFAGAAPAGVRAEIDRLVAELAAPAPAPAPAPEPAAGPVTPGPLPAPEPAAEGLAAGAPLSG